MTSDERTLDELAGEPEWMYEFDLGHGVRTQTLGPELMDIHRTRASVAEPVARAAFAGPGATGTAMDLACSEGWFGHRMLEWGARKVTGVDIRDENVRRARMVAERLGVNEERLRFQVADVYDVDPAAMGTFDVVLCFGLIYHLENPVGALRIARALTRGACIVETQLTEQVDPIRHGWGQAGEFTEREASWAAYREEPQLQEGSPIASHGGVISFVPNRAALFEAMIAAGFSRCEPLVPQTGNAQYVDGNRIVVVGYP